MEEKKDFGSIRISDDVVAIIAGIATSEIAGISGMSGTIAGGLAEMLAGKKSPTKGVKVDLKGSEVTIDLHVTVDYGVRIPEVAWEIQEKVKSATESMTGLDVLAVNVHIDGVRIAEPEKAPEKVSEEEVKDSGK